MKVRKDLERALQPLLRCLSRKVRSAQGDLLVEMNAVTQALGIGTLARQRGADLIRLFQELLQIADRARVPAALKGLDVIPAPAEDADLQGGLHSAQRLAALGLRL